ncbi:nucleotidyltransferase family protein [Candidatus Bathyarchaeota archaeon]|nr:nucleotidyltransferase family protein [Candidatus Bathyarchaeota archaeon]
MKAVILAGGQGKRLKPLTDENPKPLIRVAGKPIVVWQMRWLKHYGVESFILSIGYLKERFLEVLGSGRKYGVNISYVVEEEPLGTGGGLKNAEPLLKNEEFFYVVNGDVLTDIDLGRLLDGLGEASGVIALVPLPSPYGIVRLEGSTVSSFEEKPVIRDYWINAGVYLFKSEVFKYLPERGDLEKTLFPRLAEEGRLKAVKYLDGCFWKSVDTWKDLEEVEVILGKTGLEQS